MRTTPDSQKIVCQHSLQTAPSVERQRLDATYNSSEIDRQHTTMKSTRPFNMCIWLRKVNDHTSHLLLYFLSLPKLPKIQKLLKNFSPHKIFTCTIHVLANDAIHWQSTLLLQSLLNSLQWNFTGKKLKTYTNLKRGYLSKQNLRYYASKSQVYMISIISDFKF